MRPIINQEALKEEIVNILLFRKGGLLQAIQSLGEDCNFITETFKASLEGNFTEVGDVMNELAGFVSLVDDVFRVVPGDEAKFRGCFLAIYADLSRALEDYKKHNHEVAHVLKYSDFEPYKGNIPEQHRTFLLTFSRLCPESQKFPDEYIKPLEQYIASRSPY